MAYLAAKKCGISDTYANVSRDYSGVPDGWDTGFWQSYNHYWNPALNQGYAPLNCAKFVNDARSYHRSSQLTNAYKNLGYSTHYMSDLGNPMHTGKEANQTLNKNLHYAYENYVTSNWNSGYKYENKYSSATSYYVITDPMQSSKNLAIYSNARLEELYQIVYLYPETFGSNSQVISITDSVVFQTAKYNIGLVQYMRS
jgi:hypothetical protein